MIMITIIINTNYRAATQRIRISSSSPQQFVVNIVVMFMMMFSLPCWLKAQVERGAGAPGAAGGWGGTRMADLARPRSGARAPR